MKVFLRRPAREQKANFHYLELQGNMDITDPAEKAAVEVRAHPRDKSRAPPSQRGWLSKISSMVILNSLCWRTIFKL